MMQMSLLSESQSRLEKWQLAAVAGLVLLGALFVYSATMSGEAALTMAWYDQSWFRQLVWYGLGAVAGAALCLVDYRGLARWSMVGYWLMMLLLAAVLIPGVGSMRFGARRWIDLGFFQFQPSEFAKLAFLLAQAHFLSRPADELRQPRIFWQSLGLTALPFLLILRQPDLGSALVLVPAGFAMLYAAGAPRRLLLRMFAAGGVLAVLFLADVLFAPPSWQFRLEDYQTRRLKVFFDIPYTPASPNATKAELERLRRQQLDDSYNVRQALISVGSGGLTGKGWRQGTQNALGYLPRAVAHNDFIFSVIAEEEGFLGSVVVLALYGTVLFTGIRIAGQARDRLGRLLAAGVVALLFSQIFINLGMNIRLMPVTGVPLPLLSYGGSSVLVSLMAIGLLQNIYFHRKSY